MRVLMLTQYYPPYFGGEERLVQHLSRALVERGHEVAVATLEHEGSPAVDEDQGVRIYRLSGSVQRIPWVFSDQSRRHMPPLPDPEMTLALRRVVGKEQPQIVHAHNWLVHSYLPLKRLAPAKLVLSLHDYSLACPTKKLMFRNGFDVPCSGPGFRKCLGCAAEYYGPAKALATVSANQVMSVFERGLVDLFLPVSRATAVGNGLEGTDLPYEVLPNFMPSATAALDDSLDTYLAQLPAEPFLMFAGAFASYKGVDTLLEAYRGLQDAPPLVLIGYQTSEYPIETTSIPPNVVILQHWPHEAVMEAWRRSLVGLAPSRCAETFGLVALEAMMVERPVIASRIGGLQDVVIDGETGLLVNPGDVDDLQRAIEVLLAQPELRERLGHGARKHAELFTSDAVLPRLEALYDRLVAKPELATTSSADGRTIRSP